MSDRRLGTRILTGLAAAVLAGLGVVPTLTAAAPAASADTAVKVMPLGDSITGSPGCWRQLLWSRLQSTGYSNVDFVGTLDNSTSCGTPYDGDNEGHGGFLATNILRDNQLPGWLSAARPDVVMMHLGTNDVWNAVPTATLLTTFGGLVDQMRASNPSMRVLVAKIIPMNPSGCPDCGQRVVDLNAALPAWAATKSTTASPVTVVDQWTGFSTSADTGDGVHPNATGNQKMADRWYPALTSAVGPSPSPSPTASSSSTPTSPTTPPAVGVLTEVTGFGDNPSKLRMYVYRPASAPARPAIVVGVHYCHGDGPAYFNGSGLGPLADRYGFMLVIPSVTQASDGCFDVASPAALTRGGGSDPVGIKSMIDHTIRVFGADSSRVYVTGVSSGGMMTNVLLGDYPDVFKAGAAFAGVPFGCFAGANSWNSDCASGLITRTAQQWGDVVRAAYPGYSGPRPRVQLWHGTQDTTLSYVNFGEEIKEWTNVLGVSQTPTSTDSPSSGVTRTRYATSAGTVQVEAYSLAGVGHNLPVDAAAAIHFFGLDATTPSPTPTITPTVTPTITPTGTTTPTPTGTLSCTAAMTVVNSWGSGFIGSVKVTAGGAAISRWTVGLTVPSGGTISNLWNGQLSGTTVTAASWNGPLAAGGTTEFGFQAAGSPTGWAIGGCTAA
jgi:acetylxylan esterase